MSLVKRGKIWHYDFQFDGKPCRGTTNQTNKNLAKQVEANERSRVALVARGMVPAVERKVPFLANFIEERFIPHIVENYKAKPATAKFYIYNAVRLLDFPGFKDKRLDEINKDVIDQYREWRGKQRNRKSPKEFIQPAAINSELHVLRRIILQAFT